MLKQLYIKNFTLIDTLDINFGSGFSVITGETGAGKSIILGAIGLLLGQRADSKTIKKGVDKCVIEAHFDLSAYTMADDMRLIFDENDIEYDATDCIIRRELTVAGKSRAFVNDTPVALTILKELGDRLVDVHSQHQNLLLNKQDFQLNVVDTIAADGAVLAEYRKSYNLLQDARERLKTVKEEIERNNSNADFLQYQYTELSGANLVENEQEELEQKAETMSHSEDIKSALYEADEVFNSDETGVVSNLRTASNAIVGIVKVLPAASELAERIQTAYVELKDVAQEIETLLEGVDFNPAEFDAVNNRLDKLYNLEKKYRCDSIPELIALRESLKQQLDNIENSDETLKELAALVEQSERECRTVADKLTKLRGAAAQKIEKEMKERLVLLGMPNVRFKIAIDRDQLSRSGHDKVSFLFSANTSTELLPVSQVASGGEIARVMLALKAMISGAVKLPTIIFDEIDTGVSGKIAEKMAQIMQEMGDAERQVISITHLPQIAALGRSHYKVAKEETAEGTISTMVRLDQDGRMREIAQMLSGSDISEAAMNNARELLKY